MLCYGLWGCCCPGNNLQERKHYATLRKRKCTRYANNVGALIRCEERVGKRLQRPHTNSGQLVKKAVRAGAPRIASPSDRGVVTIASACGVDRGKMPLAGGRNNTRISVPVCT